MRGRSRHWRAEGRYLRLVRPGQAGDGLVLRRSDERIQTGRPGQHRGLLRSGSQRPAGDHHAGQPQVGEPYRQEYSPGNAEDMGRIAALNESATVPYGSFTGCVRTEEWSMLESGTEKKWYCRGVGVVRTESTAGEVAVLVSVTR